MQIPAPQQPAADFLQSLAGVPPTQTHISAIFVGETVYKIKKAVRLPFLDFTTLESRARFIRREFALNHRTAPKIYRASAPFSAAAAASCVSWLNPRPTIRWNGCC